MNNSHSSASDKIVIRDAEPSDCEEIVRLIRCYERIVLARDDCAPALLHQKKQIALDMNCSQINLCVLGWNKNAKDLYERYGYEDFTLKEDRRLMRLEREGMEKFMKEIE